MKKLLLLSVLFLYQNVWAAEDPYTVIVSSGNMNFGDRSYVYEIPQLQFFFKDKGVAKDFAEALNEAHRRRMDKHK